MVDTPRLSSRKDVLEFFIRRPEGRFTMAEIVKHGYVQQQLKHHLIKLSAESQIDEVRDGRDKFYSLSPTLRRQLKTMQAEDKRKADALEAQLKQAAREAAEKETMQTVPLAPVAVAAAPMHKPTIRKGPNGETRNAIFDLMKSAPDNEVSIYTLAELFDVSPSVVGLHIRNLIRESKVKCTRKTKNGYLYLPIPTETIKAAPRNTKQEILEYFQKDAEQFYTANQIAEVMQITAREAYTFLKNLCEERKIKIGSNGRLNDPHGVKYKIDTPPVTVIAAPVAAAPVVAAKPVVVAAAPVATEPTPAPTPPPEPVAPAPVQKQPTAHIKFLKSIVQRLKNGQPLNEYDIEALDEHINSL